jgi:peptide/nickel transport system permease protein
VGRFVFVRLVQAFVSLFVLSIVVFGANQIVGDPTNALLPPTTSFETREAFREEMGFNRPFIVQYLDYMAGVLTGDMGESLANGRPVAELIAGRLPATMELALASALLTLAVGIPLGLLSSYRRGTWLDQSARLFSVLGQSAPTFWVGILLVLLFAVQLGWLPPGGRGGLAYLILPAITLAWNTVAGVTRLMRSSALETLESDYVRFARVKGLSEGSVMGKHVLRNASLPVMTYGGVMMANAMTGSVVTEAVFVWPGIGRLLIDAISARDYPVVQGTVLIFCAFFVVFALLIDLLYLYLNPRLRAEATSAA